MFKRFYFKVAVIAVAFGLQSCSSDDNTSNNQVSEGNYQNGVLILNEGGMAASTSSVDFLSDSGIIYNDIYRLENGTANATGSLLQSMFLSDDYAFIISGLANQITVVDRYTFKYVTTIATDLVTPRYGVVVGNKAFVTNTADFSTGTDDFLTVIDLTDYSTTRVAMNDWSEKIISFNHNLYVMNGYYESGNSITVISSNDHSQVAKINLNFSPNSLVESDNVLYVLGQGKLAKINLTTNEIIGSEINLGESFSQAKNLAVANDQLYFTENATVYKLAITNNVAVSNELLTYQAASQWSAMYGFAVNNGKIYIAEGGDFASNSEIFIYSISGELLNTYQVGIAPNGFYFN